MIIDKDFSCCVIDIEASGFGVGSYPIEIGIVLNDNRRYETLIRPAPAWSSWDPEAEAVHGLKRSDLLSRGRDIHEVCETLNRLCKGKTLYSDCWAHDSRWLQTLFTEAGIPMLFKCSATEFLLTEAEIRRWRSLKNQAHLAMAISRHRAMNDAIAIAYALQSVLTGYSVLNTVLPAHRTPPHVTHSAPPRRQMAAVHV